MLKNEVSISRVMLIAIAVIFLSAILGVTFYYLSLKKAAPVAVAPTPAQTPSTNPTPMSDDVPAPTPTPDETADWNVYKNEEYGFEFKYKSDWQLKQQDNYIEIKPIINNKPEEISISVNIITNRPKDYTLAGWLLQNGNNNASCDFVKKVDKIEWCGVNSERFEAVRADDYGVTKNDIDYDIQFRVAYGRQEMDYYISDKELSSEIDALNQILSTFEFTEKDETADWKTYQNKDYGISFQYPSTWLLEKDGSADKNLFGMSFAIENINTTLSVIGVTNKYMDDGPPGWFGYCAVAYKNVDQFCKEGCIRINDKTATKRGRENHGDAGYSFLAYTNASKNFPSICWELDMGSILSKVSNQKGIKYYEVKNEDVETYIKENDKDEDLKDIIQKFEEFSQSIKSF